MLETRKKLENVALSASSWLGSVESLIVHTLIFVISFSLVLFGVNFDRVLLVLTTALSLEAIYLAIFIQMSVNKSAIRLAQVEHSVDEIAEDVVEIAEDVVDIAEDVVEIAHDVEGIEKDIDEIQEDVEGIEKDVDEMQEESKK